VAAGAFHLVVEGLFHAKRLFIAVSSLAFLASIIHRVRSHPPVLAKWGFSRHRLREATGLSLAVFLGGAILILAVGWVRSTLVRSWHLASILLHYPVRGLSSSSSSRLSLRPFATG
jgi:hypothetical protein